MTHGHSLLLPLLAVLLSGAVAVGQCIGGDDGFENTSAGCCTPIASATLPVFPSVTMSSNWAEFVKCVPSNQQVVTVTLNAPSMVLCDYATITMSITFPSGETINGLLAAKYVRTFTDLLSTPVGQVWRFLINGDLTCAPNAAATPCTSQLPRCCFVPGQQVHFDGHIDYRCVPGTILPMTASFSLTHHTGCVSHAPWSCVPMGGLLAHTEASYHVVGPAPFAFGAPSAAPSGSMVSDSVRTSFLSFIPSFTYACLSEQKIGPIGTVTSSTGLCVPSNCALTTCTGGPLCSTANTPCYENLSLNFATCCIGAIWGPSQTVPIPGTPVAATGMFGIRLGTWGALPQYPAAMELRTCFGVIQSVLPTNCPAINSPINAAVGVVTSNMGSKPFTLAPTCLAPAGPCHTFMDFANALPLVSAPSLTPGYGCLAASDIVWSFNLP